MGAPALYARVPLPPFPTGWFAVAFSHELRAWTPQDCRCLGTTLRLTRRADGPITAADLPSGAVLAVQEQQGAVFVWHDPLGRAPLWTLPQPDPRGWTPYSGRCWPRLQTHPQEVSESTVGVARLAPPHRTGERRTETHLSAWAEGPVMTTHTITLAQAARHTTTRVQVVGLGYALIERPVAVAGGLQTRQLVLATPLDGESTALRILCAACVPALPGPLADLATRLARWAGLRALSREIAATIRLWETKRLLPHPHVVSGDGPIGRFRAWCRQFYPEPGRP